MIFDQTPFSQKVSMDIYGTDYSDVEISMTGKHQGENLKTALAIIEILRKEGKIKIERSRLYEGLKKAVQPGRFEVLVESVEEEPGKWNPMVIIDGAHNEAGAKALHDAVKTYFEGRKILLITGMLADKQTDEILGYFTEITKDMIVTEPDNPRKLSVDNLAEMLNEMGIEPVKAKDAKESVKTAEQMQEGYDLILFAGSLYLIGDVRRIVRNDWGKRNN